MGSVVCVWEQQWWNAGLKCTRYWVKWEKEDKEKNQQHIEIKQYFSNRLVEEEIMK